MRSMHPEALAPARGAWSGIQALRGGGTVSWAPKGGVVKNSGFKGARPVVTEDDMTLGGGPTMRCTDQVS